jgi:serine/threonine protein kinase
MSCNVKTETQILEELKETKAKGFSEIITHGAVSNDLYFIILRRYGPSIKQMIRRSVYKRFSVKTAIQIGLQLLDRLESLHKLGYLHCDLKPDNILLKSDDWSSTTSSEIILIDFGITSQYKSIDGKHIEP